MAEFDAEAKELINIFASHNAGDAPSEACEACVAIAVAALKSAHAAGRAAGLRRAAEIVRLGVASAATLSRASVLELAAQAIESELEATNGK